MNHVYKFSLFSENIELTGKQVLKTLHKLYQQKLNEKFNSLIETFEVSQLTLEEVHETRLILSQLDLQLGEWQEILMFELGLVNDPVETLNELESDNANNG